MPDYGQETLYQAIIAQLPVQCDPQVQDAARFLAASLNGSGWLDEPLEALALESGCPLSLLEQGLELLQSLEPAGIGARTLSECLTLQLLRSTPEDTLALTIAAHYLQPLAKSRYGWMARELGVSQAEIRRACDRIRTLNPRPGSGFAGPEPTLYVTPDLLILRRSGGFEVALNDSYLPSPRISAYYIRLARECQDAAVQDYLDKKLRQAKWILQHVEQRQSTLVACAQCILAYQEDFFRRGPDHLRPLALSAIAQTMGVHESTVSRALKDKYLMCDYGVFPMGHFFSRALGRQPGGAQVTPDAAKQLLSSLIHQEDKRAPLSDQLLCQELEARGLLLSRRTVAKYRDELGIPGASGRRQLG